MVRISIRWEAERDKVQAALSAVVEQCAGAAARFEETDPLEKALQNKLVELTSDGKLEAERYDELKRIALVWDASRTSLEEIDARLAEFGDAPSGAVARLEKQLQLADEVNTKALEREKSEEGRLTQLEAEGPYTALVRAEEDVARLERDIAEDNLWLTAIPLALRPSGRTKPGEGFASITIRHLLGPGAVTTARRTASRPVAGAAR